MSESKYDRYIKILGSITAIIHLLVGILVLVLKPDDFILGGSLLINGLGYFALLLAIYSPSRLPVGIAMKGSLKVMNQKLRLLLLIFTIVTIIAFFAVYGTSGLTQPIGMFTKVIEVVMVVLLLKKS